MAAKKKAQSEPLPFGAGAVDTQAPTDAKPARAPRKRKPSAKAEDAPEAGDAPKKPRRPRKKATEDGPTDEPRAKRAAPEQTGGEAPAEDAGERPEAKREEAPETAPREDKGHDGGGGGDDRREGESARQAKRRRWQERRRSRRGRKKRDGGGEGQGRTAQGNPQGNTARDNTGQGQRPAQAQPRSGGERPGPDASEKREVDGLFLIEKSKHGSIRLAENGFLSTKQDVHVSPRLMQKYALRAGSMITGAVRRGQGRHKWDLVDVKTVDGEDPNKIRSTKAFKSLTSIDPDFHYAVGDISGVTSLKVLDILAPVGRGQRGLIVAPPRAGKTTLLQDFAKAIEKGYPEVHLLVLLVDERPEEATEWKRTIGKGEVYVSTNDEPAKKHVDLAEIVWARCKRLVELGEDVVLLMDSITRLGRAYNNVAGDSGRTMSGGLDTRALERPKQFFGAARNTETAGSLTILGTTLIETGSRMDQVIFEEFKGTGNMELVLSRKLADRRIFPAIDIVKTGTRKEEKLHSRIRLARVNTLRRVLTRMHWAEAMELLSTKLDDVEKIDDFLARFDIDPEA